MNLLKYIKKPITGNDILNAVDRVVSENERILAEIQTEQWSEGKDKNNKIIGRYKPFTESISKQSPFPNKPKKAGQPYNLDWSGELKRRTSINTKRVANDVLIQIDSTASSLLPLFQTIEKHGLIDNPNDIFGYEPKKKDFVVKRIKEETLIKLKNKVR